MTTKSFGFLSEPLTADLESRRRIKMHRRAMEKTVTLSEYRRRLKRRVTSSDAIAPMTARARTKDEPKMNDSHIGSSLDDFLKEEGIYEEAMATARERVLAWQANVDHAAARPDEQAKTGQDD